MVPPEREPKIPVKYVKSKPDANAEHAYLINDSVNQMLIQTSILQYRKNPTCTSSRIRTTYHIGRKI